VEGQTLEILHLILKPFQQKILIDNQMKSGGQEVVKASPKEIHQLIPNAFINHSKPIPV
jgi:hypothetical protein